MMVNSVKQAFNNAVEVVATSEALFELEQREIRGVEFTTFRNGPKTLRDILEFCKNHQDADFIVYENERYSYADFYRITSLVALRLTQHYGVKQGDRVALVMRNSPEYPILFMALASIGALAVCMNSWWTSEELEYGFTDSAAKLVFADAGQAKKLVPFAGRLGLQSVVVRGEAGERDADFWRLIGVPSDVQLPSADVEPDDDFAIMYTSGSSGFPKGVVLTHRGAISTIQSWLFGLKVSARLGWSPAPMIDKNGESFQPCSLVTVPFFHVSGTHPGILMSIWLGMKMVICHKWDPEKAVALIEREQVTRFAGVPTMSMELINAAVSMGVTLDSIRNIDAGGAGRPVDQVATIAKAVPHALVGTGWGMTETNGMGIGLRGEEFLANPGVAGRLQAPLPQIKIVDENGREVAIGKVGELVFKCVSNMRCYLNQPEATADVLRSGWLYTGDMAFIDDDDLVTIVDRKKDMIIRGGENISCAEVHAALHAHPSVLEAAVFSIPDERLGEAVGACVYLRNDDTVSEAELVQAMAPLIARYKLPSKIWFHEGQLPRVGTEKIDKLALRNKCLNLNLDKSDG
jgi:acyl-CoA synthetase (AMP-forming)/AMP-acid ligase II